MEIKQWRLQPRSEARSLLRNLFHARRDRFSDSTLAYGRGQTLTSMGDHTECSKGLRSEDDQGHSIHSMKAGTLCSRVILAKWAGTVLWEAPVIEDFLSVQGSILSQNPKANFWYGCLSNSASWRKKIRSVRPFFWNPSPNHYINRLLPSRKYLLFRWYLLRW